MERITITPVKKLQGKITVPSDKSITHRSLLFSALAQGISTIKNPLTAEDCLSTARCLEGLGVKIVRGKKQWKVYGKGLGSLIKPRQPLDCGNSGTTMRLLSGILAGQDFSTTLVGDASLSQRPMDRVATPLKKMGAHFALTRDKYAPFTITGRRPLSPMSWKNKVASAQVKSCVLLAGLHAEGTTSFTEPALSRDHTEKMLRSCGARIKQKGLTVSIQGGTELRPQKWVVPGDFSSAAFFLVAGLLVKNSRLTLSDINLNPTRIGLLRVLQSMGADVDVKETIVGGEPFGSLTIHKQSPLRAGKINEEMAPHLIDEVPILAVAATQAHGKSVLSGIGDLRVKESDRIRAMATNLKAMGANIIEKEDTLIIEGPTPLTGAVVDSYHDHRIAMSMAIAGLIASGKTTIKNSDCVSISFPTFWTLLKKISHH